MSSPSLKKCTGTIIVLLWSTMCHFSASLPSRNEPRDRSIQRRIDTSSLPCGSQERFHRQTGKCYQLKSQGPCGENMVFNQDPLQRQQGICECLDHIGCEYWPFSPSAPSENKCYPLYEQGPCPDGEWLIPHEDRHHRKSSTNKSSRRPVHGICKPRTCPPSSGPQRMFSHRGTCYMTDTQGFCSTPNEHMFFIKGSSEPKCFVLPGKTTTMTKVCPAAAFGGGTYQEITVITPRPMALPVLPPADSSQGLRVIGPTKTLQNTNPDDSNPSTTYGPPRALAKSGLAGCSDGQVRSSDGLCTSLALF